MSISVNLPEVARKAANSYAHLFRETALSFSPLSCLFGMALFGIESLCDGARCFPRSPCVSVLSKAVQCFVAEPFTRRMRKMIFENYNTPEKQANLRLVVDDTPNKKSGKKNYAVGRRVESKKKHYFGQKIMVIALVDVSKWVTYPLCYAFCLPKCAAGYRKDHEVALDLIKEYLSEEWPKLPLVADSGFDCTEFIDALKQIGIDYFVEIKSNRRLRHCAAGHQPRLSPHKYFRPEIRRSIRLEIAGKVRKSKYIATRFGYLNDLRGPVKLCAVFNSLTEPEAFGYYLSTKLDATGEEIWYLSRVRWSIEVMFRDLKQNFAFGKLPGIGKASADLTVCAPFALLVQLRLEQVAKDNKGNSRLATVGTLVEHIREQSLLKSIHLISQSQNKNLTSRIKARRSLSRIHQKPVNAIAGAA